MTGDALQQKQAYYAAMDSTTEDEDETPDIGRTSSIAAMGKLRSTTAKSRTANAMGRSVSDNHIASRAQKTALLPPSAQPSSSADQHPSLQTRHTFSGVPSTAAEKAKPAAKAKATGKRKRGADVSLIPEDQQVFRGLKFYFFPNSDKHPARKLRILKATEFGATWQRDYTEEATHIIMDKGMEYGMLLKFLKRDTLPANVTVVSEDFTAECISYRTLLDPGQIQFKVKGYAPAKGLLPAATSKQSPPVKDGGKSGKNRQARTPEASTPAPRSPRTHSSDDESPPHTNPPELTRESRTAVPDAATVATNAEFEAALRQARELQDVPLDQDDDGPSRPVSAGGPQTDDESESGEQPRIKTKPSKQSKQNKFQCMQKHEGGPDDNPNAATIAILQQMADYYENIGEEWRPRSYRKAISTLRKHPTKVWTKEEARDLPQIGERLAAKIEEIACTSKLRRLDNAKAQPDDQVLQAFMKIYGVGPAQASRWVDAGYKTADEVAAKAELADSQRIGIEHYEDFSTRIPRAEVEQHGNIVKKALQKIDPAFDVIIGGSYRRGASTSGDIDCLITRPNTGLNHIRQVVQDQLVPKLFAKKFLVAALATTSKDDGSKWHGASQIPAISPQAPLNRWRRIDFLLVPSDQLGAALIYFTGNDIFNRSMRLLAGTKQMRLNQRGLYKDAMRGKGRVKISDGALMEGKDEKRIFEILGVPWRPPEHRIC